MSKGKFKDISEISNKYCNCGQFLCAYWDPFGFFLDPCIAYCFDPNGCDRHCSDCEVKNKCLFCEHFLDELIWPCRYGKKENEKK